MNDMALSPLRGLSLCAGIGGLDIGLKRALGKRYRTVCYVEREAYCASVLVARMQEGSLCDAPIWSDVKTFDAKPWRGCVDIIMGGYPCQPFSCAGQRRGTEDPRHLWPYIADIVRIIQPRYCFFENVPGHVSLGLEQVATDLQAMGYDVSAGIFSAAQVGAPHLRKRLYILANSKQRIRQQGSSFGCTVVDPHDGVQKWSQVSDRSTQRSNEMVPFKHWSAEPNVGRVAHGISARLDRLAALGNAVVPQTAALAWHTLSRASARL